MKLQRNVIKYLINVLISLATSSLYAFDVGPLVHELVPANNKHSTEFRVSNTSFLPLVLEFHSHELRATSEGFDIGSSSDEKLLVFPPFAVVEPGTVQTVRVQLDSTELPITDESYAIIVEQLPLSTSVEQSDGVQVLLSFNVVVHVTVPDGTVLMTASIAPKESSTHTLDSNAYRKPASDNHNNPKLHQSDSLSDEICVRLSNEGTANAFGSKLKVMLSTGTETFEFGGDELLSVANDLFFPPSHSRTINLTLPKLVQQNEIMVSVEYDQKK